MVEEQKKLYKNLQLDYEALGYRIEQFEKALDLLSELWNQPKQEKRWTSINKVT